MLDEDCNPERLSRARMGVRVTIGQNREAAATDGFARDFPSAGNLRENM